MGRRKSAVEKVKDAVDKVLHPDHAPKEGADQPEVEAAEQEKSSEPTSDYANHPKFSKFKAKEG